jgi:ABC-type phosphate/phosphonate transport system permease subunit
LCSIWSTNDGERFPVSGEDKSIVWLAEWDSDLCGVFSGEDKSIVTCALGLCVISIATEPVLLMSLFNLPSMLFSSSSLARSLSFPFAFLAASSLWQDPARKVCVSSFRCIMDSVAPQM